MIAAQLGIGAAAEYGIDSAHSSVTFSVRHMMVSNVKGSFKGLTGLVTYDPNNLPASSVQMTIDAATVNTNEPKRDAHLRSADFLETEKHPKLSFTSKQIRKNAAGVLELAGDLTIRGVTKPVVFTVDGPTPEVKGAGGRMVMGASATTKISRKEFGVLYNRMMEAGGVVVGDEVTISLDVELVRK
ncbi:MAG: YceI family protein [Candidatus Solibacter usitatus]|nr:YceI family protein [Candidatus Solibacter usitatus]